MSQLNKEEISYFSRHLLLPEVGTKGQLALRNSSVLVIGAGGLGSACIMHLAGSGFGSMTIIDYDVVERSNLHRQVIHNINTVGMSKARSAASAATLLCPLVKVDAVEDPFTPENSSELVSKHTLVVDCTDNISTRYLISDACVRANKPLISGSALKLQGQISVYNHNGSPCFRCLHPKPPPVGSVTSCSDGGVLGVVPNIIGSLMALEATKVILGLETLAGKIMSFNAKNSSFRTFKLRSRQESCRACGQNGPLDPVYENYVAFCGSTFDEDNHSSSLTLDMQFQITPLQIAELNPSTYLFVDVREDIQRQICKLNSDLRGGSDYLGDFPLSILEEKKSELVEALSNKIPIFYCRRGIDSSNAVSLVKDLLPNARNLQGGLTSWAKVHPDFPIY